MAKGASNLSKFTSFQSEDDAIAMLERLRWPNGAACPFCGGADPYRLTVRTKTPGKRTARKGLWKCSQCRKQFTAKVGTVMEASHIPVSKWLMALHLISASKKGMSALQFSRMLGLTYRAAWFLAHRLRHAMAHDGFRLSGTIEVDETYVGGKRRLGRYSYEGKGGRPGPKDPIKTPVVALVERNGRAIAFPVARVDGKTLQEEVRKRTIPSLSWMMSDEWQGYMGFKQGFVSHEHVNHGIKEFVRGHVHTNTVEGFFAILKRSIKGTFHHVSKQHLHRYCDEVAFRYTNRIALGGGRRTADEESDRRDRGQAPDVQAAIRKSRGVIGNY